LPSLPPFHPARLIDFPRKPPAHRPGEDDLDFVRIIGKAVPDVNEA
jgi:hypothetical protein